MELAGGAVEFQVGGFGPAGLVAADEIPGVPGAAEVEDVDEAILLVLDNFESHLKPQAEPSSVAGQPVWACQDSAWDECLVLLAQELAGSPSRVLITSRKPASRNQRSRGEEPESRYVFNRSSKSRIWLVILRAESAPASSR